MCLQVYPDGYGLGEGRYLSALACMMIGEMDNALKWPFTGEVRFSLPLTRFGIAITDSTLLTVHKAQVKIIILSQVIPPKRRSGSLGCISLVLLASIRDPTHAAICPVLTR